MSTKTSNSGTGGSVDLFRYPLPIPSNTIYTELKIGPEASDDEVRWALKEFRRRLEAEKVEVSRKLEDVYAKVPGLSDCQKEFDTVNAAGADADSGRRRELSARLTHLEEKALAINSEFRELREKPKLIDCRIQDLNRLALDKPDQRLAYGQEHPPLALLQLADASTDRFLHDQRTLLFLLRRELSSFLSSRGENVFHPSDLTREDFTHDFAYNPLLDPEHHER